VIQIKEADKNLLHLLSKSLNG